MSSSERALEAINGNGSARWSWLKITGAIAAPIAGLALLWNIATYYTHGVAVAAETVKTANDAQAAVSALSDTVKSDEVLHAQEHAKISEQIDALGDKIFSVQQEILRELRRNK